MINNDKLWRRSCTKSMCKPNQSVSLRAILDRTTSGLPVNAKIAQHTPLPPDGDDMDDFETGTAEYIDLVDVQHMSERVQEDFRKKKEDAAKKAEEERKKAFDEAVQLELQKLQQNGSEG